MIGVKPGERHVWSSLGGAFTAVAVAGSVLCACGFQPMYGQRRPEVTPVSSDLASIEVGMIPDRSGQLLRNELTYLLNPASDAGVSRRYTLSVG